MSRTDAESGASGAETTGPGSDGEREDAPTVLIADDKHSLTDLYVASLPDGYATRIAHDGEEALSLADGAVDVALLDRQMPKRTGEEVLERIREAGYGCRVAMLTGVDPDFDLLEMGFDAYLVKPVGVEELRATVERLLTLADYDADVREYHALLAKRTALEAGKGALELERDERYLDLVAEIEAVAERLAAARADLEDVDPAVLFDDLGGNALGDR